MTQSYVMLLDYANIFQNKKQWPIQKSYKTFNESQILSN